jgi:dienelactone hydrolase
MSLRGSLSRSSSSSLVWLLLVSLAGAEAPRAKPEGKLPDDRRLGPQKTLNDYFPFTPPKAAAEWQARADELRRQTLVGLGLWPMPAKTPANAVVHGRVNRDGYTVERVYLESFPGHFVTGSLYRPTGRSGRLPGVLCPHGHWPEGRFYDQNSQSQKVRDLIVLGAERFEAGGRSPLQARCVQLARMGCVVFHYDMVGYADSKQLEHRPGPREHMNTLANWGLRSPQAELRLQTVCGLQTYNSIRALDWFSELPDVDPERIGVTGASGGGTQTFLLGAIDPRPAVIFPAVMVGTAMQGGCTCENACYLRRGTGNVELAGLFAPKPLGMTGADDWTKEIMTKGLPELQQLYALLGAKDRVMAKALVQFPHNYNYVSRAVMYAWFNKHLKLGLKEPIVEEDYVPLSVAEMTVWDDADPKPPSGDDYERSLLRNMTEDSRRQLATLAPRDEATWKKFDEVIGGAFRTLVGRSLPPVGAIEYEKIDEQDRGDWLQFASLLRDPKRGEEVPVVFLMPKKWNRHAVIWLDEQGKRGLFDTAGDPIPAVAKLLAAGFTVAGIDLLGQGEFTVDGEPWKKARLNKGGSGTATWDTYAAYTFGYNDTLFAQRVHDVLSLISYVKHHKREPEEIALVGFGRGAAWAAAAMAVAGPVVDRAAINTQGFRFAQVNAIDHPEFWPGAVKYGDLPSLLAMSAGRRLWLAGEAENESLLIREAFTAVGKTQHLQTVGDLPRNAAPIAAAEWLVESVR